MSDTPKTDEAVDYASNFHPDCEVVNVEVAIDLERELAEARKQRDIAIEAIKEIMANEEGLHRMGYNPYLISHAAMEKINNHEKEG